MSKQPLTPKKQYQWWTKGECVVEILKRGHFPTSVIAKLPDGKETEIDLDELEG